MTDRIILDRNVPCPMRDGTILMADVFRPDGDGRHPVLVQRTPYDKTFYPFTYPAMDPTKMVQAGYAVVIQDVRGRFASMGEYEAYAQVEAEDGFDTIAWAAEQPWSNGAVGMYGISYMGGMQWMAASERPPALRAIAPTTSPGDFTNLHFHRGGALQLGLVAAWHVASIGPNALARRFATDIPTLIAEFTGLVDDLDALDERIARLPLRPFPPVDERGGGFAPWLGPTIAEERLAATEDPVASARHASIDVPVLQLAGWYDLLLQADLDHHVAMRERGGTDEARRLSRIVVGPWAHAAFFHQVGEIDFGFRASGLLLDLREDLTALHKRWFDARLRGEPSGIDDEPPVKVFVMGRNRWRSLDTWPPPEARAQQWHVHGDGSLAERPPPAAQPSVFTLDPDDPVPTCGGNTLMALKHMRGPREQSSIERRPDVLTFTSEPMTSELEIAGRVRFVAWVAAETVDTDVVARLCDVGPDGASYNVVDGILRLRFRESLGEPAPLTPGEVVRVEVDLWSTAHVFLPGHRVRLQVCASDFPRYDRCPGTGESSATAEKIVPQRNLLFHDPARPSHVELPVVSG